MSVGEVRVAVDAAVLMANDQLNLITSALDVVSPLSAQVAAALRGTSHPEADVLVARLDEMTQGLQAALGAGSSAVAVGALLLTEL
ncbi:hypothetical protein [Saccharothrix sp. HUAS TT1]|uniref:hypothetical protein n=1 Tax=unclassified Saccharothrix TaxID=2593673 RepID=UPI00345BF837